MNRRPRSGWKEIDKLLRAVVRQGGRVEKGGGGHWRVYAPDGVGQATLNGTRSRGRALENSRAALRRIGFDV